MFIAAAKVTLDFYGNFELPRKHAEMKKLSEEIHRKFNVSAAEISEDIDDPEHCVLGLALASSTNAYARTAIDKVLRHLDNVAFARVTSEDIEIYQIE